MSLETNSKADKLKLFQLKSKQSKPQQSENDGEWITVSNSRKVPTNPYNRSSAAGRRNVLDDSEKLIEVDVVMEQTTESPEVPEESNRFVRGLNALAKRAEEANTFRQENPGFRRNFDVLHRLKGEHDSSREQYEEIRQYLYRRPREQHKYTKPVVQEPIETDNVNMFPSLTLTDVEVKQSKQNGTVWGKKDITKILVDPLVVPKAKEVTIEVNTPLQEGTEIYILKSTDSLYQDLLMNKILVTDDDNVEDTVDDDGFVTVKKRQNKQKTFY